MESLKSFASSLSVEEVKRSIMAHDRNLKLKEKLAGLIPRGDESIFGNFPKHFKKAKMPKSFIQPNNQVRASFKRMPVGLSEFRRFYDRGDLPIQLSHWNEVSWKRPIDQLDYHHYLPIFFDGLREQEDPYRFLAIQGCYELIAKPDATILPVVPQLIIPIKTALSSRNPNVAAAVAKLLAFMVTTHEKVGEALVPYYRQILPGLARFLNINRNIGDQMDFDQKTCIGDIIRDSLEILETKGGQDAFINIKYIIPTYQSIQITH